MKSGATRAIVREEADNSMSCGGGGDVADAAPTSVMVMQKGRHNLIMMSGAGKW